MWWQEYNSSAHRKDAKKNLDSRNLCSLPETWQIVGQGDACPTKNATFALSEALQ